MQQSNIKFSVQGQAALVLLDRPKALNALDYDMAVALRAQLEIWDQDDKITHVVMAGSSPRAFCAGGDVRALHQMLQQGQQDQAAIYFRAEYLADMAVHEFSKPIVSLANGVVMGGGAGLMQASTIAVVSDSTKFAMPESAIGLFPDAGASVFLGRCPRAIGLLLGFTGRIIDGADCLMAGLAHSIVKAEDMITLQTALLGARVDEIDHVIAQFRKDPGPAPLMQHRAVIEYVFGDDDPLAARDRAHDMATIKGDEFAAELYDALSTRCPMTMMVFQRLMQMSDCLVDTGQALILDYNLAVKMTRRADFCEGIRAVLVDKTNDAKWSPARLEDVTVQMVDDVFDDDGLPPLR